MSTPTYWGTSARSPFRLSTWASWPWVGSRPCIGDYPYWIGKGEPERASRIAAVCEGWVLAIACLVAALYSCLAVGSLLLGESSAAAAWATQSVVASLSFYMTYLACTYRSANEFVTWSKIGAVTSVVSFLLLPLVALLGFWGLCIRAAVPASINGALLHRSRPVRIAPQWNLRELWRLIKFGLAMDISGFLATSCLTATMASLVASAYGLAVLGLFTFARLGETVVTQFAAALVSVFIPRIHQQMGMTDSLRHCALYSLRPTLAASLRDGAAPPRRHHPLRTAYSDFDAEVHRVRSDSQGLPVGGDLPRIVHSDLRTDSGETYRGSSDRQYRMFRRIPCGGGSSGVAAVASPVCGRRVSLRQVGRRARVFRRTLDETAVRGGARCGSRSHTAGPGATRRNLRCRARRKRLGAVRAMIPARRRASPC